MSRRTSWCASTGIRGTMRARGRHPPPGRSPRTTRKVARQPRCWPRQGPRPVRADDVWRPSGRGTSSPPPAPAGPRGPAGPLPPRRRRRTPRAGVPARKRPANSQPNSGASADARLPTVNSAIRSSIIFLRGTREPRPVSRGAPRTTADRVRRHEVAGGRPRTCPGPCRHIGQQAHHDELGRADAEGAHGHGRAGPGAWGTFAIFAISERWAGRGPGARGQGRTTKSRRVGLGPGDGCVVSVFFMYAD